MAEMLYDSLHQKLLALDDAVLVYPAHGAGSMCGRNISKETSSTIGEQRRFNYALQPMSRDEFVQMMTSDLPEQPAYFSRDAEINRTGAAPLHELPRPAALEPRRVLELQATGHLVLDVRDSTAFGTAHVPGAMHIGLGGQFASWAGSLIPAGTTILLVADDMEQIDEAVMRLARVGIESVAGYLDGSLYAWDRAGLETGRLQQMPVAELHAQLGERKDLQLLDVRRPGEYEAGHVPGAAKTPLAELHKHLGRFDRRKPLALVCATGYRSSIAGSILARHGFASLFNVVGGTSAWVRAGYPAEIPNSLPLE
jgi:rhodanese-related sulfurtransferase